MSGIFINSLEAAEHAIKIGQASDKLTVMTSVTFSSSTTVSGNSSAESTFHQFKNTSTNIKNCLNRDIANIHSSVAAFKRADKQVKNLIEGVQIK